MNKITPLPLADWIDAFVSWLTQAEFIFGPLTDIVGYLISGFEWLFGIFPPWLLLLIMTGLTFWFAGRKIGLTVFVLLGLLLIWNLGYWEDMVLTLAIVLTAGLISIVIGVPVGIWMSRSPVVEGAVKPVLDFMQTMPAFVYLIPAVAFFGIGMVPGVVASVIFAMPPTIRFTNLGIRQVPTEIIEASEAFGSTGNQKLFKVQLPMAKTTIMAGINQTIMLALSMVVIASMIGADGLGTAVYFAVGRNDVGGGFEAGLAIVIVAIILDRLTQGIGASKRK
ncbi:glycine/betaine ABC transporter [Marinococcus halophilus]|uniref:Glycine/betaine ABC transporter permease n=1 Tax=Marinococcus halophilus TaxID=1371 RepID=A0A510Y6Y5_MARHA|nr:proline/glycine betaine ABC transporter permease [Marinococcus halophilus]OZT79765.1 glycine/betaine ABC transporter [Marinococcus halophilus]GEK59124.1 glycine/betaine ABC transporter permease [Marinococcus halophilus]